jgi:hypothetical protein
MEMEDIVRDVEGMQNVSDLNDLNDQQSMMLTLLPYINFNEEGLARMEGGDPIKVSELTQYLENPDAPFFDRLGMSEYGLAEFDSLRGKDTILSMTEAELVDTMVRVGLGDLEITGQRDERGFASSGFQAIAFKDSTDNVGISYRGSDFDLTRGAARDWIEANIMEFFKGSSTQSNQANEIFDQHKNPNGNNYVFGASLGGNLSQHVYAQNYNDIAHVFTINGNPINQKALDTPEKIAAFNDQTKASFNVVCGDPISMLKSCDLYQDSVHYIQNHDSLRGLGGLESHIDMGVYDNDGNFKTTTRDAAVSTMTPWLEKLTAFARDVRDTMNRIGDRLQSENPDKAKPFKDFIQDTIGHFDDLINEIQFSHIFSTSHSFDGEIADVQLDMYGQGSIQDIDQLFGDGIVFNLAELFPSEDSLAFDPLLGEEIGDVLDVVDEEEIDMDDLASRQGR